MATVFRFTTELRDTGYVAEQDLKAKLLEVFGAGDYRVSTKQERWIYFAPRKLTCEEMSAIIKREDETD